MKFIFMFDLILSDFETWSGQQEHTLPKVSEMVPLATTYMLRGTSPGARVGRSENNFLPQHQ